MPTARATRLAGIALALGAGLAHAGQDVMVLAPADAARFWQPAGPQAAPPWPSGVPAAAGPSCVHIGFRIDARGRTGDFTIVRRWSGDGGGTDARRRLDEFSRHAAAAVSTWRFTPVTSRARPVYTAANLGFSPAGDAQSATGPCAVEDFARFFTEAQRAVGERGSLMQKRMDVKRQSDPVQIPYDKHDWFDGFGNIDTTNGVVAGTSLVDFISKWSRFYLTCPVSLWWGSCVKDGVFNWDASLFDPEFTRP